MLLTAIPHLGKHAAHGCIVRVQHAGLVTTHRQHASRRRRVEVHRHGRERAQAVQRVGGGAAAARRGGEEQHKGPWEDGEEALRLLQEVAHERARGRAAPDAPAAAPR